jgi:hypothetical protein
MAGSIVAVCYYVKNILKKGGTLLTNFAQCTSASGITEIGKAARTPQGSRSLLHGRRQAPPPLTRLPAPRPGPAARRVPGSRGAASLQQRGIPLALAQQLGVGYAAPGA